MIVYACSFIASLNARESLRGRLLNVSGVRFSGKVSTLYFPHSGDTIDFSGELCVPLFLPNRLRPFTLLTAVYYRHTAPPDIHRERFTVLDPETLVLQSAQEGLTSNQLQSRLRSRPVMPSAEEDLEERLAELGMVL